MFMSLLIIILEKSIFKVKINMIQLNLENKMLKNLNISSFLCTFRNSPEPSGRKIIATILKKQVRAPNLPKVTSDRDFRHGGVKS